MRRKIEKFLARKRGVDDGTIEPAEDGRYDFMGDLEGVLAAVRGNDPDSSTKKKPKSATRGGISIGSANRSGGNSARSSISGLQLQQQQQQANLPMPSYYPHYTPYGMGMYPPPMGQHPHMMAAAQQRQNNNTYNTPWAQQQPLKVAPPTPLQGLQNVALSTPAAAGGPEPCLSTAHKSVFDLNFSPPPKMSSPGGTGGGSSIQGMTPPLSCLKDIFATPGAPSSSPSNKQMLSSPNDESLNKSLFADHSSVLTPFNDKSTSTTPIRFRMTACENATNAAMRLGNRVSVSPMTSQHDAFLLEMENDDDDDDDVVEDTLTMPPPPQFTPGLVASLQKHSHDHDDDDKLLFATTPSTAATSSFWGDDSTCGLSPFRTPLDANESASKRRRT